MGQIGRFVMVAALVTAFCVARAPGADNVQPAARGVVVLAAASLTDAFKAISAEFEKAHPGVAVQFSFAGSSTLVQQIGEGAPADVFASADEANMQKAADAGELAGPARIFATNSLVIAVPAGNPKHIASLGDLTRSGLSLVLAAPAVPAGKYAAQAFAKAGLPVPSASQEVDVRAVLNKVALDEADAGIVYVTDIRAAGGKVEAVPIPEQYNVVARYPIAVLKHARDPNGAAAFVDFVLSPAGRTTLETFGFMAP
jgi:molybdate transport system substrate-binding protein